MRCGSPLRVACVMVLLCLSGASATWAQTQRVVVLYDERVELPGLAALDASLVRTLTAGSRAPIEIYRESMDLSRFGSPAYVLALRDQLRAKYEAKNIDVVIAAMGPSLDFLLDHGDVVFPGTPIVFCGIDRRELGARVLPARVTGVLVRREFKPTLELALRLHPDTTRIVFVGGTVDFDTRLVQQARREFRGYEGRLAFTYLTQLSLHDLLTQLGKLPPQTVVLYSTLFRDGAGQAFVPHEAAELISAAASAPVYGFVDQYVGRGIVGGHVYSLDAHGEAAARLALQVLAGTRPSELPLVEPGAGVDMFDWRQLRRWGIDPSQLPETADIRFKTPTAWDQYRFLIMGTIALAILQAVIIAALVIERSGRRQSQERYALASAAGGVGVWDWNLETNDLHVDANLKTALGYTDQEIRNHLDDWMRLLHPDDVAAATARVQEAIESRSPSYELEHRMLHRDGSVRWFLVRGSVVCRYGRAVRVTGTETDITDRKLSAHALDNAQLELARVSRLTALGEFAASIAHEVRQPLTTIIMNARTCLRWLDDASPNLTEIRAALTDIAGAGRRADELIRRNRELFRQHTVEKEALDINSVIREVAVLAAPRLQGSQVTLTASLASELPDIIGDRIELQQVLLNLILNAIDATERVESGARRIEISTSIAPDEMVKLSVADNGVGLGSVDMQRLFSFSYTTKPNGTGIGLSLSRSIVEAHGGQLWAEDNASGGATFWFTLPVHAAAATMAAAAVGVPIIPLAALRSDGSAGPASRDQRLP